MTQPSALKEDLMYRHVFTLRDGARMLVRPLTREDRQALLDLFLPTPSNDRQYIRHDVSNPDIINAWIDHLDYDHVLPLVAIINNQMVGEATLHFKTGVYRHRAEVRIFLAKDFRERGVGTRMIQGLIELARRRGIHFLEVEVVSDQSHLIKAFHNLGFETKAVLEDFYIFPDGETRDLALLILRLRANPNEF